MKTLATHKRKKYYLYCCGIINMLLGAAGLSLFFIALIFGGIWYNVKFGEARLIYENSSEINRCYRVYKDSVYATYHTSSAEVTEYYVQKLPNVKPQNFDIWENNASSCIGVDRENNTIFIANVPIKDVDLNTFQVVQLNETGYSFFGDKNNLYLVIGFPTELLEGKVNRKQALKVLTTDNIYTVRALRHYGILFTSKSVYFDGVLLLGLNAETVKYAPFPESGGRSYSPSYVLYDTENNIVYCRNKKVNLDVSRLAFYRYSVYSDAYKKINDKIYLGDFYLGDGTNFYDDNCNDIQELDNAPPVNKLVFWQKLY